MSKRKVRFREEELNENEAMQVEKDSSKRFKSKHSLDSDEEEDNDNDIMKNDSYVLTEDDVEGQEDDTIDHDGDIKITPFNLKEEMDDGYFDSEGNYFVKKEKEIRDDWLDSIDWGKVKERNQDQTMEASGQFEDANEINTQEYLQKIITFLKPGETILKAIRRLGGKSKSTSSATAKLKAKKQKLEASEQKDVEENKEQMLKLTELADTLLQSGDYGIYQDTYEKLQYRVKNLTTTRKVNGGGDDDDDDELEAVYHKSEGTAKDKQQETLSKTGLTEDDQVYWQYKWEEAANAQLYGPFSSSEMLEWTEQGYFKDGVLVRKIMDKTKEAEGQFYSSKRIDFELYT